MLHFVVLGHYRGIVVAHYSQMLKEHVLFRYTRCELVNQLFSARRDLQAVRKGKQAS